MAAQVTINGTPLSDEHVAALTDALQGFFLLSSHIEYTLSGKTKAMYERARVVHIMLMSPLLEDSPFHGKSGMQSAPLVYASSNALHIDQAPLVVYEDAAPLAYYQCGNCTACANPVAAARGSHFYCTQCGHGAHFHYKEDE